MFDTPVPRSDQADGLARPLPTPTWRERIGRLADATGTTPLRLAFGLALSAAALLGALWMTRPPPAPPEVDLPFVSTSVAAPATSVSTAPSTEIVVHVAGGVISPGVHRLRAPGRVIDAIDAAGGLGPDADAGRINLAAPLQDGERIFVPILGQEPSPLASQSPSGPREETTGPLDLNRADAGALDTLPGIGPATADAIIEHRERIGGFTSVDQLLDVRGIGDAKLEQIRPLVAV